MRTEYQRDRDRIIHSQGVPPAQAQDAGLHRARPATTTSRGSRTRSRWRRSPARSPARSTSTRTSPRRSPWATTSATRRSATPASRRSASCCRRASATTSRACASSTCWSASGAPGLEPHVGGARGHPQALQAARGHLRGAGGALLVGGGVGRSARRRRSKARSCASPTPSPTSTTTSPTPSGPACCATEDLPARAIDVSASTHSQRIDTLVSDIVDASWDAASRRARRAARRGRSP